MFCHKCGTKIPDDAEYCYCYGTKIEKITTIKKWFCPGVKNKLCKWKYRIRLAV